MYAVGGRSVVAGSECCVRRKKRSGIAPARPNLPSIVTSVSWNIEREQTDVKRLRAITVLREKAEHDHPPAAIICPALANNLRNCPTTRMCVKGNNNLSNANSYLTATACGVDLVYWILWLMLGMLVLVGVLELTYPTKLTYLHCCLPATNIARNIRRSGSLEARHE